MLPPNFVLGLSEDDSLKFYGQVVLHSAMSVGVQQPNYHAQFLLLGVEKQAAQERTNTSAVAFVVETNLRQICIL